MPAKSKAQLRFMQKVAAGEIKAPGLSKAKAAEFVASTKDASKLPERRVTKIEHLKKAKVMK